MTATTTSPDVLSPERAQAFDPKDRRFLDVRTPGEFESAHIGGSVNLPLDLLPAHADRFAARREGGRPLVLVCRSGGRARQAANLLHAAGAGEVLVLDGGVKGWLAAGHQVNRGRRRMSLERQVRIVAGGLAALGGAMALLLHPWFAGLSVFVGSGLVFAGVTDTCAMGVLLARMPHNRGPEVDAEAAVCLLCDPPMVL